MKTIAIILAATALVLTGCTSLSKLNVPPGTLTSWTHTSNYGPWQSKIVLTAVTKNADGSFTVGHYDGQAGWLGFGPHDVIEGLHIDAQGTPAAATATTAK